MIDENADVIRITSYNRQGDPVVQYALPAQARLVGRMSFEQYNNVEYDPITFDDLPDDLRDAFKEAAGKK